MESHKVPYMNNYCFQFLSMTCQMQTPILKILDLQSTKFIVHDQAKLDRSAKSLKTGAKRME